MHIFFVEHFSPASVISVWYVEWKIQYIKYSNILLYILLFCVLHFLGSVSLQLVFYHSKTILIRWKNFTFGLWVIIMLRKSILHTEFHNLVQPYSLVAYFFILLKFTYSCCCKWKRKRIVAAERNSNCSHLTDTSCLLSVKERSVPLLLITPSQRFFSAKVTGKKKTKNKLHHYVEDNSF